METIFDHGITEEEFSHIYSNFKFTKEQYLEILDNEPLYDREKIAYGDLYNLYMIRNKKEKAMSFTEMISDKGWVTFELLNCDNVCHR